MKTTQQNFLESLPSKELVKMYNQHCSGNPVKRFADRATAIKRTLKAVYEVEEGHVEIPNPEGKVEKMILKSTDDRKITLTGTGNPKRKGSKSFKRFALYVKCETVSEYIEAGGRKADLNWDSQRGFITY